MHIFQIFLSQMFCLVFLLFVHTDLCNAHGGEQHVIEYTGMEQVPAGGLIGVDTVVVVLGGDRRKGSPNCKSAWCKPCPTLRCPAACPYGYVRDVSSGCNTCACKPECPPITCNLTCPYGLHTHQGCDVCKCLKPKPKLGLCPAVRSLSAKICWLPPLCNIDLDCEGQMKCCGQCPRRCMDPQPRPIVSPTPNKRCPQPKPFPADLACPHTNACSSDSDCPPNGKCCLLHCSTGCVEGLSNHLL